MTEPEMLVIDLYRRVWSEGALAEIERLVAPRYMIHSDPGDAWEGRALDHAEYRERLLYSRRAFPDLTFEVEDVVAAGDRVAVRWSAAGMHLGELTGLPATGRRLTFAGQTIYAVKEERLTGHWQVVDRLGFVQQLR